MLELFPEGFEEREAGDALEVVAYTDEAGERALGAVHERLGLLGVRADDVEEGWEERWRLFHHGVRIGPVWVGPPWEEPPADATAVVIDPGRAFGTGAHATTRLCIELLHGLPRSSLLDVGCGSGVLAIAAAKLGFSPVVAIDVDPDAVAATVCNAGANGVQLEARIGDALVDELPATEAVAMNVTLDAVEAIAPRLRCAWLVTSGYLVADRLTVRPFVHRGRAELEGWAADVWECG